MKNLQVFLLYNQPRFFTKESILKQISDFAGIGLYPALHSVVQKHASKIEPLYTSNDNEFWGQEFLEIFPDLLEALEQIQLKPAFNTHRARQVYAEFTHYLRRLPSDDVIDFIVKDKTDTITRYDVNTIKELTKQNSTVSIPCLRKNIKRRVEAFKLLIDELLIKQLCALKALDEYRAEESLIAAQDAFGTIQQYHLTWQENRTPQGYYRFSEARVRSQVALINQHLEAVTALTEQARHNVELFPASLAAQENCQQLEQTKQVIQGLYEQASELFTTMKETTTRTASEIKSRQKALKSTNERRLERLIHLVSDYLQELQQEKKSWSYFFNVFHWSRKDAKIKYCETLVDSLNASKATVSYTTDVHALVMQAHNKAYGESKDKDAILAGGRFVGTSRLLSLQRLLNIDEAWQQGKVRYCFFSAPIDYHGLQTTGIIDSPDNQVINTIHGFYHGSRHDEQAYDELVNRSLHL